MPSPNKAGRPKGIVDKRMRLQKSLLGDADEFLEIAKTKAREGDPQMLNLLLSRVMPALRPQNDDRVQFDFDPSKPLSAQLQQIAQAVANGDLTLEQGDQFSKLAERLATVRAMEGGGDDKTSQLINAFKEFAQRCPV